MNTRSLRRWKSATIVRANSSRIASPRHRSRMRLRQLVQGLAVLRVVHRQVVGGHGVLHVTNAVTLDGVADDGQRSSLVGQSLRALVAQPEQRREVVSVGGEDVEAESV